MLIVTSLESDSYSDLTWRPVVLIQRWHVGIPSCCLQGEQWLACQLCSLCCLPGLQFWCATPCWGYPKSWCLFKIFWYKFYCIWHFPFISVSTLNNWYTCFWRPEIDIAHLALLVSTFFFFLRLAIPWPLGPPVSVDAGDELRFSCLCSNHVTCWTLSFPCFWHFT